MLNHSEHRNESNLLPVVFAVVTSLFFGVLLWLWERDLVWMLAVLLPPIWTPVIYRRFGSEDDAMLGRRAVAGLLLGLVALVGLGLVVFVLL